MLQCSKEVSQHQLINMAHKIMKYKSGYTITEVVINSYQSGWNHLLNIDNQETTKAYKDCNHLF